MPTVRQIRFVGKPAVFALCLAPFVWLMLRAFEFGGFRLGPNPIEDIQDEMGIWALRFLLITLAMTPLRLAIGKPWPLQFRRMLGLFAFFYAALHFLNYLILDQSLTLSAIVEDIVERPFITVGLGTLVILIPLAVTSTAGWRRRLGQRWVSLHRLVYAAAIGACWHFYWQVKKDVTEPLIYIALLGALLAVRLVRHQRRRRGSQ